MKPKSFLESYRDKVSSVKNQRETNVESFVASRLNRESSVMSPSSEAGSAKESKSKPVSKPDAGSKTDAKFQHESLNQYSVQNRNADISNIKLTALAEIFRDETRGVRKAIEKLSQQQAKAGRGGNDNGLIGDVLDMFGNGGGKRKVRPGAMDRLKRMRARGNPVAEEGFVARSVGAVRGLGSRIANVVEDGSILSKAKGFAGRAMGSLGKAGASTLEAGSSLMSSVAKIPGLSTAGKILGKIAAPLTAVGAIVEGSKEDSTDRYAKRFGTTTEGIDDSASGMAKFMALRAGGAATDIAQSLDPSSLWNKDGDSWTDRLFSDRRADAGKTAPLLPEIVGETLGRGMAVAMTPFSEDARAAVLSDWKNTISPGIASAVAPVADAAKSISSMFGDMTKSVSSFVDRFSTATGQITDGVASAASSAWAAAKSGGRQLLSGNVSGAYNTIKTGIGKATGQISDATKLAGATLGGVSEKFESGGRGVGTVSGGVGDHGGVSYGKHQLATNNGSMGAFLKSKEGAAVSAQLAGLQPGTKEFNDKYKQLTSDPNTGKAMDDAQHQYIQRTHFDPQAAKLKEDLGMDVGKESKAVQEAVWSTSVQYGANSSVISKALKGKDLSKMSDADKVTAIQDYKAAHVDENFASSSEAQRKGVANRIQEEKATLLAVNDVARKPNIAAVPKTKEAIAAQAAVDKFNADKAAKVNTASQTPSSTTPGSTATSTTPGSTATSTTPGSTATSTVNAKVAQSPVKPKADVVAANVKQNAVPMVSKATPAEVSSVNVANQPAATEQAVQQVAQAPQQASAGRPTLDDSPLQVTDMGLILVNTGHI